MENVKKCVSRKNLFSVTFIIVLVNCLSLTLWYNLNIKPLFLNINALKEEINSIVLQQYRTLDDLKASLNTITQTYNVNFTVSNIDQEIIYNNHLSNDFFLSSKIILVDNNSYLLHAYLKKDLSVLRIIINLIFFQVIIISFLLIITYLVTGFKIIKPIDKIIDDIKNYKFGKKPTRNVIHDELDIIQNEFVNLVDSLEYEKDQQHKIVASISHDIKTPLTSIIGYSSLINDEDSLSEIKKYSLKINEKALHIKDLLASFDDYLVNFNGKKLTKTKVFIKDIVKDLELDYKVELSNKKITFSIECDCLNDYLNIDYLKIKRVFSNIISNSIRYLKEDGQIMVLMERKNNMIYFRIKDNGPGISDDIKDKVFNPFFTTDPSRTIAGLGLAICKEFIELHQGSIRAYNDDGLTVEFTLPLEYS